MNSEIPNSSGPNADPAGEPAHGFAGPDFHARFYQTRFRIMVGLAGFVLLVGLPLIGIPKVRHRLHDRVQTLREALGGEPQPKSVVANVGENTAPFPPEFERKIEPLKQPTYGGVVPLPNKVYTPGQPHTIPTAGSPAATVARSSASPVPGKSAAKRKLTIPPPKEPEETAAAATSPPEKIEPASNEPQFRQGAVEKECYDLLLQSSATVAGMVNGNDPTLRFKDWSAAKMEDESYLVRVNFVKDRAEVTYIWQVKPQTKQVAPLNFNARSLPK